MIVDRDPHRRQLQRHCLRACPRRFNRAGRGQLEQLIEDSTRGIMGPMRRSQPSNTTTFLIDRNQQVITPVDRTQIIGQSAQLLRVKAVAAKQDIARRIRLAEECALIGRQFRAGTSEDRRYHVRILAGPSESGKQANHL